MEFKWIRLGLAAKWENAVKPALRLATVQVVDEVVVDEVVVDEVVVSEVVVGEVVVEVVDG